MATQSKTAADQGPLHDVSAETIKSLDAIGVELDIAQGDIEALEKVGMDVSRLKERLDWGRKAREIILERFKVK
jgi:soluble P-type ATPase